MFVTTSRTVLKALKNLMIKITKPILQKAMIAGFFFCFYNWCLNCSYL